MFLIVKLGFSLVCLLLGLLTVSRLEHVLRYAKSFSSSQERMAFQFYKLMWAVRTVMFVLFLWAAGLAVWSSWFLAIFILLAMPVVLALTFPIGRLGARRTLRRRRYVHW